jgi:hypothetical protein
MNGLRSKELQKCVTTFVHGWLYYLRVSSVELD